MGGTKTRSGKKQPAKKQAKPKIFMCPYTNQNVFIQRATVADLKSKSTYHSGGKKRLWTLSSSQQRHDLYADAAGVMASIEQNMLPSFGGRSWDVTCKLSEPNSQVLFRAWKGKMELAVLPHLLEKIPDPPRWPGQRDPQGEWEVMEGVDSDDEDPNDLQSREVSTLSSVAWDLKWQYPAPTLSVKWVSPDYKIFNSRKAAWEHAKEIAKKEMFIEKHVYGIGASGKLLQPSVPSGPMALKIGKARFERDGLWVVNQELSWQDDRPQVLLELEEELQRQREEEEEESSDESAEGEDDNAANEEGKDSTDGVAVEEEDKGKVDKPKQPRKMTPLAFFLQSRKKEYKNDKRKELNGARFTLRQAEQDLRLIWKALDDTEKKDWETKMEQFLKKEDNDKSESLPSLVEKLEAIPPPSKMKDEGRGEVIANKDESIFSEKLIPPVSVQVDLEQNESPSIAAEVPKNDEEEKKDDESSKPSTECKETDVQIETTMTSAGLSQEQTNSTSTFPVEKEAEPKPSTDNSLAVKPESTVSNSKPGDETVTDPTPIPTKKPAPKKLTPRRKTATATARQRWCLKQEQIDLCYTACINHYEDVMRTVKARDLVRELADGFDVLRERGRGRFDMTLPAFDTPEFDFLTDFNKTPWMPIVKTILGDDIVLIHKGCFLSMPDAEVQVYHQDGVHLTTQTQRPCHAINVFVPLTDLTSRNGPTEFCLGSHILGNEGFDKDFLETPKPKAGIPVIFDYRLGHRGLGNNSNSCRPIVYCTYARASGDSKLFRDKENFSKKRYHQIGELTAKPLSREERRLNRKRSIESRKVEQERQKVLKAEQESDPSTSSTVVDTLPVKSEGGEAKVQDSEKPIEALRPTNAENGHGKVEAATSVPTSIGSIEQPSIIQSKTVDSIPIAEQAAVDHVHLQQDAIPMTHGN